MAVASRRANCHYVTPELPAATIFLSRLLFLGFVPCGDLGQRLSLLESTQTYRCERIDMRLSSALTPSIVAQKSEAAGRNAEILPACQLPHPDVTFSQRGELIFSRD